uniref:Uncharacterized protein n=1 Tax=Nelumbo nucifera TaxID=4432 RepID=A0A822YQ97_NELNU|nr:TPA_asm: hypothetical protein HUJ06_005337 [Nelumbo nucifera]
MESLVIEQGETQTQIPNLKLVPLKIWKLAAFLPYDLLRKLKTQWSIAGEGAAIANVQRSDITNNVPSSPAAGKLTYVQIKLKPGEHLGPAWFDIVLTVGEEWDHCNIGGEVLRRV